MNTEKPSCYNCTYIMGDLEISPCGFICPQTSVEHFYPDGLPESRICDEYKHKSGISIKDKYPKEVPAFRLMLKEKGYLDEEIEEWLSQDSASIEK